MYNLLISYYFSILFDVLHEKFGLNNHIRVCSPEFGYIILDYLLTLTLHKKHGEESIRF